AAAPLKVRHVAKLDLPEYAVLSAATSGGSIEGDPAPPHVTGSLELSAATSGGSIEGTPSREKSVINLSMLSAATSGGSIEGSDGRRHASRGRCELSAATSGGSIEGRSRRCGHTHLRNPGYPPRRAAAPLKGRAR